MTKDQFYLLLTVARIMRARLKEEIFDPSGNNKQDHADLCEALRPYDPLPGAPINEAAQHP